MRPKPASKSPQPTPASASPDGDNGHADEAPGTRETAAREEVEGARAGGRSVAAWNERTSKPALASTVVLITSEPYGLPR